MTHYCVNKKNIIREHKNYDIVFRIQDVKLMIGESDLVLKNLN